MSAAYNNIPRGLRELDQWVVWRHETNAEGKPVKPPYRIDGRAAGKASSTDPNTWTTFEIATSAATKPGWDGIGFALTETDEFAFVDLDGVVGERGIDRTAASIVKKLAS